jgi:hypothetical protein
LEALGGDVTENADEGGEDEEEWAFL